MKSTAQITGHSAKDSPLRQIFPGGIVPLKSIHPIMAILGDDNVQEDVYLLDLRQCEADELERIAQYMLSKFDQGIEEARKYLAEVDEFPIRKINIIGVGFPSRLIA